MAQGGNFPVSHPQQVRSTPSLLSDTVGVADDSARIGVIGSSPNGIGFLAGNDLKFDQHAGVYGESDQQGVFGLGMNANATGVFGSSLNGDGFGVRGESGEGVAIQGRSFSGDKGLAGRFIGNVHVQGNPGSSSGDLRVEGTSFFGGDVEMKGTVNGSAITCNGNISASGVNCTGNISAFDVLLSGGDCAEDFDIAGVESVDPGTVMVLDEEGALRPCDQPYDKKVSGVISGAGGYKPGIVLDKRKSQSVRLPIALVGKVYCKVDAGFGGIEVGDLLTTSPTTGHAMKADNPLHAFGAVIGKALRPLKSGRGLVPILVSLQ
jgi:hypothetical protein